MVIAVSLEFGVSLLICITYPPSLRFHRGLSDPNVW
jgi:hypothetical protein